MGRPAALFRAVACGVWLLTIVVSCFDGSSPGVVRTTGEFRSDIHVSKGLDVQSSRVDSVEVLWGSEELGRPTSLAVGAEWIAVAEERRVHLLSHEGAYLAELGRAGAGPGEFRRIASVGWDSNSLVVYDEGNRRYSKWSPEGELGSSHTALPSRPYVASPRPAPPLRVWRGGVLRLAGELVHTDRPGRLALLWEDLAGDSLEVLRTWEDIQWTDAGPILTPASAFAPRAVVAIGRDGQVAHGDGQKYCFRLSGLARADTTRVCREGERVPVGRGVTNPQFERFDLPSQLAPALREAISAQEIEEYYPSYDRMLFSEEGHLWVRIVGAGVPDVHPLLRAYAPAFQGWDREWDLYDSDGMPLITVSLPGRFDPWIVRSNEVFGFYEAESGEILLAKTSFRLPPN